MFRQAFSRFLLCLILLVSLSLFGITSCSNENKNQSSGASANNSKTSSTISASKSNKSKDFHDKVQDVCNSVDPAVFDAVIGVDPAKDPGYEKKFDDAIAALDNLYAGFSAIEPPASKKTDWDKGLKDLSDLKLAVSKVSDQYDEYIALTEESKTNQDLARTAQIIQRLLELGKEYFETISQIQTLFQEVLLVGSSAGVSKCRAFEIGQNS